MELSGLQFRVLGCVAAHDRMSLLTGKGQGCRASNVRMSDMINCNFSRLCSTLTTLVDLGLIQREKLGRHSVYRVIYEEADMLLFSNLSSAPTGCPPASQVASTGCRRSRINDEKLRENTPQYIPLNGGIDSEESGKESSSEEARTSAPVCRKAERTDNIGGQLARFERALSLGEVLDGLPSSEWVESVALEEDDPVLRAWANRLSGGP